MSTRAIVGVPWGDGVRGRYVHSDGYPTHLGAALWRLVAEDFGGDELAELVCWLGPDGWSWIVPDSPEGWGRPYNNGKSDTPEGWWVTAPALSDDDDHGGTEWGYALTASTLTVFRIGWNVGHARPVGVFRWSDPEPDWAAVEEAGDAMRDGNGGDLIAGHGVTRRSA